MHIESDQAINPVSNPMSVVSPVSNPVSPMSPFTNIAENVNETQTHEDVNDKFTNMNSSGGDIEAM